MVDTGDHAYSHALAVVCDPGRAAAVAVTAVRRGGRSTTLALAHATSDAVAAAQAEPPPPPDRDGAAPHDLGALAWLLTATRPATERAVIDLDGRHGLDGARLGRILATSPDDAESRVAAVAATWQAELDPALLARLGPGSCPQLADLLSARGLWLPAPAAVPVAAGEVLDDAPHPPSAPSQQEFEPEAGDSGGPAGDPPPSGAPSASVTLGDLLDAAAPVAAHATACAACTDRLRAIVSVRDLVAGTPLEAAPEPVRQAARTARFRSAAFPHVELPGAGTRRGRVLVAAGLCIVLLLVGAVAVLVSRDGDGPTARVEELARVPASGGGLQLRPPVLRANPLPPVVLRNEDDSRVTWRLETGVPWLTAEPSQGTLRAGTGVSVLLTIGPDAPEGDVRLAVNVVGDDGSTASVRVETTVEHPPDLDAAATGCSVTAAVEDESEITEVRLHYRSAPVPTTRAQTGGSSTAAAAPVEERMMLETTAGWTASLPATSPALMWWVTATDARGNVTKGSESFLPDGCASSAAPSP